MHRNKLDQIVDDYYDDAEIIDTNPESKYFGDDHNAQQLERIFDAVSYTHLTLPTKRIV